MVLATKVLTVTETITEATSDAMGTFSIAAGAATLKVEHQSINSVTFNSSTGELDGVLEKVTHPNSLWSGDIWQAKVDIHELVMSVSITIKNYSHQQTLRSQIRSRTSAQGLANSSASGNVLEKDLYSIDTLEVYDVTVTTPDTSALDAGDYIYFRFNINDCDYSNAVVSFAGDYLIADGFTLPASSNLQIQNIGSEVAYAALVDAKPGRDEGCIIPRFEYCNMATPATPPKLWVWTDDRVSHLAITHGKGVKRHNG